MNTRPVDRKDNLRINLEEFRKGTTQLQSLPPVLFVELTQNCNLHCRMCRSAGNFQPSLNMDNSIFELLLRDLFPYATLVDLRGWGESTLLRDFKERVIQTALAGPQLRLVTNALAIDTKLWEVLMGAGAMVVISVDASTADTMSALGRGSFDKLIRSLEAGACARNTSKRAGSITFNTVVTSLNLSELPDIVRLASHYGIGRVTLFPVVASRSNPLHLDHRKTEIPKYLGYAEDVARELGVELRVGASLHEELVVMEGLPTRCSHPWEYCYIDYAGNIGYCDHLIGNPSLTLGSLTTAPFEQIWNSSAFQKLRASHARVRQHPEEVVSMYPHCGWCYERRYVDFEDETNPQAAERLISTRGIHPLITDAPGPFNRTDFLTVRKLPRPQSIALRASSAPNAPALPMKVVKADP